jgi:hypothetical protein
MLNKENQRVNENEEEYDEDIEEPDSDEEPEVIMDWMCKINKNFKKDLYYNDIDINDNEEDEDHVNMNNTYSNLTIANAKNMKIYNETSGCITSTYTQDLRLQHEDRFLLHVSTIGNLDLIRRLNPTHRYTSCVIVPPNRTINDGIHRLTENTLSQLSHAVNITVFGGSYCFEEMENDKMIDKCVPYNYNEKVDCSSPIDIVYMAENIKSFYNQILVFNHFGREEQYQYFLKNPLKKIMFFDIDGNISYENDVFDQYQTINNIEDKTQHIYDYKILCRMIQYIYRNGYQKIIINVKYDYENAIKKMNDEEAPNDAKTYFLKKNIVVQFKKNQILVECKDTKYVKK